MNKKIDGVELTPLAQIADQRGAVLHMMRTTSPDFVAFGECYCSEVLPGAIKAWKRHRLQTQNLAVPVGRVRLVIYDDRPESSSKGILNIFELGRPDSYMRVRIPPGLWYGFTSVGQHPGLLLNCTDIPHDPTESERVEHDDPRIPYQWHLSEATP